MNLDVAVDDITEITDILEEHLSLPTILEPYTIKFIDKEGQVLTLSIRREVKSTLLDIFDAFNNEVINESNPSLSA